MGRGRKTHRVYVRDQKAQLDGLETSRGKINFGLKSAVYVDKETAEEVDARYGLNSAADSVIVAKDEQYDRALKGESWKIIHDEKKGDWVKTLHNYTFQGVDTSHFKVWVQKRGKIVRVTKAQAKEKGYKIVSEQKRRPDKVLIVDGGGMLAEMKRSEAEKEMLRRAASNGGR